MVKGRFAPSPSGRMHLGNLCTSLLAWLSVRSQGGVMLLRMEDLDTDRCREEYAVQIAKDLEWLGLDWDEGYGAGGSRGPYRQSQRGELYDEALNTLEDKGFVYSCACTRSQRLAASAPHLGEEVGKSTCHCWAERGCLGPNSVQSGAKKVHVPDKEFHFIDRLQGEVGHNLEVFPGDFIVRRSDGVYAYQLAVTVDDGRMGVTEVVRGLDLLDSTPRQLWLLEEMGFPAPVYAHVPLLLAPDGRRLSKRDGDMDLSSLRARKSSQELTGELAFLCGLRPNSEPVTPRELIQDFSWQTVKKENIFAPNC